MAFFGHSDSVEEKVRLVETLVKATAGKGWMHESFDVGKPTILISFVSCRFQLVFEAAPHSFFFSTRKPEKIYSIVSATYLDRNVPVVLHRYLHACMRCY